MTIPFLRRASFAQLVTVLLGPLACTSPDAQPEDESLEAGLPPAAASAPESSGTIVRVHPGLDQLVPVDAVIEKLADGFVFIEGPVWDRRNSRLLFSDVAGNAIHQWSETEGAAPFRDPYFTGDMTGLGLAGSNGLTLDPQGRLVVADHGRRQVTRVEEDGSLTTLVDRYEGHRLNSPNDLAYASDGSLYFTDPPYGLAGQDASPLRELDFNGVYRLHPQGELELLWPEMSRPNGIALSPDERVLYVANSDAAEMVWMAFDVGPDGLSNPRVFHDATGLQNGAADGLKVDLQGNLFATGPSGVWVFRPDGTHLGTIQPDEVPANVGWGDDGQSLYMTARTGLYRVRLTTQGALPGP